MSETVSDTVSPVSPPYTPPMSWSAAQWESFLAAELSCPVRATYGRSRTVPIQTRPQDGSPPGLALRLHRMFAEAPEQVRDDVARWLRVGRRARRACERLDAWIAGRLDAEPCPAPPGLHLRPRGRHHDLQRLAAPLLGFEFAADFSGDRPRPGLTWGRRGRSRSRRSLRLGSYDVETHVVRIHAVLDQPSVPAWFVRAVLMHEILHAAHPPHPGTGSRWIHHGPEFRARESRYIDFRRASAWEERNLPRLITAARRGTDFVALDEQPPTRAVQGLFFE